MAFFRRIQKKVNDLWYPQSVTWGKAVTTREVADELSVLSTVTRGDTYAVGHAAERSAGGGGRGRGRAGLSGQGGIGQRAERALPAGACRDGRPDPGRRHPHGYVLSGMDQPGVLLPGK